VPQPRPDGSGEEAFDDLLWGQHQGAWVKTVATVAIGFLLAFCPLVSRALGCAPPGLTMGMPLQSTAARATERCWWKASKSRAASGRICSKLRLETDTPVNSAMV
jgi:hypothetical protein